MENFNAEQLNDGDSIKNLEDRLFSEEFTLKNVGNGHITPRHLQYWKENGLLPNKKREHDENHKFNFLELMWINVIYELSLYKYPIERIKKVKQALLRKSPIGKYNAEKNIDEKKKFYRNLWKISIQDEKLIEKMLQNDELLTKAENIKISLLSTLILLFIQNKIKTRLIIHNNGIVNIAGEIFESKSEELHDLLERETYIAIPVFKLIKTFVDCTANIKFLKSSNILDEKEVQLLEIIKSGKYESMKVTFKNKAPYLVEMTEKMKITKESRLSDLIISGAYEKIEITTQAGQIAFSPKTTKLIL